MHKLAFSSVLAAALIACGGSKNNGGGGGGGGVDGGGGDGGGGGGGGGGSCTASASYTPNFSGAPDADYSNDGSGDESIQWQAELNSDAEPDVLDIELYSGFSVFGSAITTGTFTIGGSTGSAETDYATCALCSFIYTNIGSDGTEAADYFWKSGSVTLTSVTPSTFSGSFQNLVYRQVEVDQSTFETTDDPDGCTSSIGSATFSVTLDDDSGSGSGSGGFVGVTSTGQSIRIGLHR